MDMKSLQGKLDKRFDKKVTATLRDDCIVLSGQLSSWNDIVQACSMSVDKKKQFHVVNDIVLSGVQMPEIKLPTINDRALDNFAPDVLIIGGGISGASIARELSKWNIRILLVDKESDLALHASGRNDGEVHPGVDLSKGSLKHHYVVLGNKMYDKVCSELNVPFKRVGQFAAFTQGWTYPILKVFAMIRRKRDNIEDTSIVKADEIFAKEPLMNKNFKFAIYNACAGSVCPYGLTIAYAENAVQNGVKVSLNTAVLDMDVKNGSIASVKTNRGTIYPKIVINAAGVFAEDIAKMAQDRFYSIHPRRGTNSILDKKASPIMNGIASIKLLTLSKTHTKGGGLVHTAHDNILVGPNAVETYEKENTATDKESIADVFKKQKLTVPTLSERDIITYFTGVRAPTFEEDFVIEKGRKTKNIIHCAGIQSPGLTTAPAVALDIEKFTVEELSKVMTVEKNKNFNPIRKGIPSLKDMPPEKRSEMIKENPDYGVIVCRCEEISKGEIIDALNSPICVPTVDGIKKRVRPGMGRCQGGFCSPLVTKIIADYLNVPLSEVKKCSADSVITYGETKEVK